MCVGGYFHDKNPYSLGEIKGLQEDESVQDIVIRDGYSVILSSLNNIYIFGDTIRSPFKFLSPAKLNLITHTDLGLHAYEDNGIERIFVYNKSIVAISYHQNLYSYYSPKKPLSVVGCIKTTKFLYLSAAAEKVVALDTDGCLYLFEDKDDGQCVDLSANIKRSGIQPSDISKFFFTGEYILILMTNGKLYRSASYPYAKNFEADHQYFNRSDSYIKFYNVRFEAIGSLPPINDVVLNDHNVVLMSQDGSVYVYTYDQLCAENFNFSQTGKLPLGVDAVQIAASNEHVVVLGLDGKVYTRLINNHDPLKCMKLLPGLAQKIELDTAPIKLIKKSNTLPPIPQRGASGHPALNPLDSSHPMVPPIPQGGASGHPALNPLDSSHPMVPPIPQGGASGHTLQLTSHYPHNMAKLPPIPQGGALGGIPQGGASGHPELNPFYSSHPTVPPIPQGGASGGASTTDNSGQSARKKSTVCTIL